MRTEDLVASLAGNVRAVPRGAVPRRIAIGIAGGAILTMILMAEWLGLRPDLSIAVTGFRFWMKWAYTIAISAVAVAATIHLARPEAAAPRRLWWLVVPAGMIAALALGDVVRTPPADWATLWQGGSWQVCTRNIAILSLPIFAGIMLAFRRFAPTRLRLTGAVAGLAAGACGAVLYCLHCPEVSALFVLVWYSLGIVAAAAIGALAGPRLLRW